MSWARTVLDPITRTASAHASDALKCTAAPVLSVPEKGGRTRFWERPSLSQRAGCPAQWPPNSHGSRWLVASSAGTTAAACAGSRRRHPGLAQSWPGRTRVHVAYLKLELSVLLKSAKDL